MTATDVDLPPQTITFSLAYSFDQSNPKFSITSAGELSFIAPPDFEAPNDTNRDNIYELIVKADDGHGGSTTKAISVQVTPVNEYDPVFNSPSTANVPENTKIVLTVAATDADIPSVLTFSIIDGMDGARFAIEATSGLLSFIAAPDFEEPSDVDADNVYELAVAASDGFGRTTTQSIRVAVTPVNDAGPMFTSPLTAAIPENTTAVMTVTATDADLPPQTLTFSIIGSPDQSSFVITSDGMLAFKFAPDFEVPIDADRDNVYVVAVQANDGNGQIRIETINVSVADVGDAPSIDFGDAPDGGTGTGFHDYNTQASDSGPHHTIVPGLRLGTYVEGDNGALQNEEANADDTDRPLLLDDEDGLTNSAADLVLAIGGQPIVNVRATNTTGTAAILYGWIDYNADGVFDNATEHASIAVPNGSNHVAKALTFPVVPPGFSGKTYARFRLSTDAAAANPTGTAADGEVEDYVASIDASPIPDSSTTKKIAHLLNGGPSLVDADAFGSAAAPLGDLDGDGVTDLAVGATGDDTGGNRRGAVHVLFMNATGTVKNRMKIASNTNGGPTLTNYDYFGSAVASIGDLDGDGITDLAIGARALSFGANSGRGSVHVLFMNATGTVKSSQKFASGTGGLSLASGDYFGSSVASLGDLDGDGISELAVGAIGDDAGGTSRGAVYVLFLNAAGTIKNGRKIASSSSGGPTLLNNDGFGCSLAALGDLNRDGVTDLAVGAQGDDTGGESRGAVHVLFMNATGTVKSRAKIASGTGGGPVLANGDNFGASVASIGDIDGDGVTDLAIGATGDDTGGNAHGAVHLLFLRANGSVKSSRKIANNVHGGSMLTNADSFGSSVAFLGDLDGDGAIDLAVGATGDDTGGSGRGAVYVLFFRPRLPGDFNQDNAVDAADYVVWRKTNGTSVPSFTGADGSGNGLVGQDDYELWRANFGNTLPAAGGTRAAIVDSPHPAMASSEQPGALPEEEGVGSGSMASAGHPHPSPLVATATLRPGGEGASAALPAPALTGAVGEVGGGVPIAELDFSVDATDRSIGAGGSIVTTRFHEPEARATLRTDGLKARATSRAHDSALVAWLAASPAWPRREWLAADLRSASQRFSSSSSNSSEHEKPAHLAGAFDRVFESLGVLLN